MPNRNHFRAIHAAPAGGRRGELATVKQLQLETPAVVPGINIVGGAPGPDRNGGLWRPVKWWMFLHEQVPAFQCNILHPLDLGQVSPTWSGWRQKPFPTWIADWQLQTEYPIRDPKRPDNGYPFRTIMNWWEFWRQAPGRSNKPPIYFSESAGHALDRETLRKKCEEKFGLPISQETILDLQLEMGADVVLSLDRPVARRLGKQDLQEHQAFNLTNGLTLLRLMAQRETAAMPYIAVHGLDREGVEAYIDAFMAGWQELPEDARAIPFGIAVGSLSSVASQPHKLIDIMRGVQAGLRRAASELGYVPPVHVLGGTSQSMAVLVYLGADTFSTQSYVDAVKRGGYLTADLRTVKVGAVSEEDLRECNCFICSELLKRGFWGELQAALSAESADKETYRQAPTGEDYTKSDLSALVAMHNWVQTTRELERIRLVIQRDRLPEYICALATQNPKAQRLLRAVERLAEMEEQTGHSSRLKEALSKPMTLAAAIAQEVPPFVLPQSYEPPKGADVLVLVDSPASAELVERALAREPILPRIHLVQLLPGHGVVPVGAETGPLPGISFAPHHETVLKESLDEYVSRFRTYYQHMFSLSGIAGWRKAVEWVARPVSSLDDLVAEVKRLPARPATIQLSLWD